MKSHEERRGPHIRDATEVGLRGHSPCPHSVSEKIRHGRCEKPNRVQDKAAAFSPSVEMQRKGFRLACTEFEMHLWLKK